MPRAAVTPPDRVRQESQPPSHWYPVLANPPPQRCTREEVHQALDLCVQCEGISPCPEGGNDLLKLIHHSETLRRTHLREQGD